MTVSDTDDDEPLLKTAETLLQSADALLDTSKTGCVIYVDRGSPEDRGRHVTLGSGKVTIGTSSRCDITLKDPRVSRRHLELRCEEKGIAVRDLGSTNGTFYLDNRLESALLNVGARLVVGHTTLALLPISHGAPLEPVEGDSYGELIGGSLAMRRLYAILNRLEETEVPALIYGETGTGKELVARSIHFASERAEGPLVVLDCGAIPRDLVESEIFGHVKGSFTGAVSDREGAFERADGGTLFLDEVGELPLELQPRLLRALESGEVKRVGGGDYKKVDVRVLSATHRDLRQRIEKEEFRSDLYYRLAVLTVEVPPLRQRVEDIPQLGEHFAKTLKVPNKTVPPSVLEMMRRYDWPGNVRELRNAVMRVLSFDSLGSEFGTQAVETTVSTKPAPEVDASMPFKEAKSRILERFEAQYLQDILDKNEGNISQSARSAGLDRGHFKALLKKHGIEPKSS